MPFADRTEAGVRLGLKLAQASLARPVVLALPRGGVPVGFEVARLLGAPLDVVAVRKLGVPEQRELAMGAIGEYGARVLDDRVLRGTGVSRYELEAVAGRERLLLEQRMQSIREVVPLVPVADCTAIVVDDGMATGSTARVACQVVRLRGPARVVLAVPVAPPVTVRRLREVADDVIVLEAPPVFHAVGQWYENFEPVSDAYMLSLLRAAHREAAAGGG
jgi:predicted phosphoribosyltransferase